MPTTAKTPAPPTPPAKSPDLLQLEQISGALDGALADIDQRNPSPAEALAIIGVAAVRAIAPLVRGELDRHRAEHAEQVRIYQERVRVYEAAVEAAAAESK
jgi:hypothetical protein